MKEQQSAITMHLQERKNSDLQWQVGELMKKQLQESLKIRAIQQQIS